MFVHVLSASVFVHVNIYIQGCIQKFQDSTCKKKFCLWVVSTDDAFIACDDVKEECGIVYQFPSVPDRSPLDCLSDPGSTLSAQTSQQSDACSAVL